MSAPTTHDPRFVNTKDGVCWERRAVTDSGLGLYAVEGSCKCPPFKMATLAELAEHGIAGSADVLPVPVGPKPRTLDVVEDELDGANLARWEAERGNDRLFLAWGSARMRSRRKNEALKKLKARIAELEAELRIGSPWKCHVCGNDNRRDVCVICETDRPEPRERTVDEDPIAFSLTAKAETLPPPAREDDVSPQVRKLRNLLAGQRAEAGERP